MPRRVLSFFKLWLVLEGEKPRLLDFLSRTLPHKPSTAVKHSFANLMKAMSYLFLNGVMHKILPKISVITQTA